MKRLLCYFLRHRLRWVEPDGVPQYVFFEGKTICTTDQLRCERCGKRFD